MEKWEELLERIAKALEKQNELSEKSIEVQAKIVKFYEEINKPIIKEQKRNDMSVV